MQNSSRPVCSIYGLINGAHRIQTLYPWRESEVMNEEAAPPSLQINWSKMKIQQSGNLPRIENSVAACNSDVELVVLRLPWKCTAHKWKQ